MESDTPRAFRVGSTIEDLCRQCKSLRRHTVLSVAGDRSRVLCDTCGSQHNYRGAPAVRQTSAPNPSAPAEPFPLVSDRERSDTPMEHDNVPADLETMLRRVIREETGLTPVVPAQKWRDGELVLRPARGDVQEKTWPIETFFHKIVMLRNRLRTLEQQLNGADLPEDLKIKLQGYVTGCYGSLTSFNVLFADEDDRFRGASGKS